MLWLFFIIGILLAAYAIGDFLSRISRKEPLWEMLRKLIVDLMDAISGIG